MVEVIGTAAGTFAAGRGSVVPAGPAWSGSVAGAGPPGAAVPGRAGAGGAVRTAGHGHGEGVRSPARDPDRLERARGLLRRMEDRADRTRSRPGDDGRLLPVSGALSGLLPGGGLRRGDAVAVVGGPGSGALLFALLAEASAAGAWAGVVGRPDLGVVAAAEAGVRPERLALIPEPGAYLLPVVTALLDGLDLVAVADAGRAVPRATDRQRLAARARQRGAVLLALGSWPGADVRLRCARPRWEGTDGGAGRLRARRVEVHADGRGAGAPGRSAELLLPGPDGTVTVAPTAGVSRPPRVVEPRRSAIRVAG